MIAIASVKMAGVPLNRTYSVGFSLILVHLPGGSDSKPCSYMRFPRAMGLSCSCTGLLRVVGLSFCWFPDFLCFPLLEKPALPLSLASELHDWGWGEASFWPLTFLFQPFPTFFYTLHVFLSSPCHGLSLSVYGINSFFLILTLLIVFHRASQPSYPEVSLHILDASVFFSFFVCLFIYSKYVVCNCFLPVWS